MSKFRTLYDNDIIKVEEYEGVYRVSFFNDNYECVESYVYAVDNITTESEREGDISEVDALDILEKMYKEKEEQVKEKEDDPSKMEKEEPNKDMISIFDVLTEPGYKEFKNWTKNTNIPNCCKNCPNHPSNGGSGVCNCTAPLFDKDNTSVPHWTTWATSTGAEQYTSTHNTNKTEN